MLGTKCPGQDTRYWKAEDIHEQPCPFCDESIEFWKTDLRLRCPNCKQKVVNPRFNLGCAQWCAYADQCLRDAARDDGPETPREALDSELFMLTRGRPQERKDLQKRLSSTEDRCRQNRKLLLPALMSALVQGAADLGLVEDPATYLEQILVRHDFPSEAVEEARLLVRPARGDHEVEG